MMECGSRYSWLATSSTALPGRMAAAERSPALLEAKPLGTGNGGNAHDVQESQLPDGGSQQRPDAQLCCLAEPHPAPAEPGTEAQLQPEHRDQQDGGLGHHADGGEAGHQ